MEFLQILEENALAVSALTGVVGVIAALFSAFAAWRSAGEARHARQAAEKSEQLRLVSQISETRSRQFTETRRALFLTKELLKQELIEALATDQLSAPGRADRQTRLKKQIEYFEKIITTLEPLLTSEGDAALGATSRVELEKILRRQRAELHDVVQSADHLRREADQLHAEQLRDHRPVVR
jgi:hypothetical protein